MEILRFENPGLLHLLWGVLFLIFFFIWTIKYKRRLLQRFGNMEILQKLMQNVSPARRNLKIILLITAFIFLIIALANPQIGTKIEEVKREGLDIIVAIDVSKSMLAEDIKPNRLEKAKHEIGQLINILKGDRIGIIAFAGIAHVQCPLTLDYSAAKLFLNIIDINLIPQPGTAIGKAINKAVAAFNNKERKYKVLIMITDGEDHESDPLEAAKEAEKEGIIIYTVGIGSPQGVPIPMYDRYGNQSGFKKDRSGSVVTTKLDVITLQKIAYQTGGKYYLASTGEAELNEIYNEISTMEKKELASRQFSQYEDRFQIFLAFGLVLLIIELLIPERRRVKTQWKGRFIW
jgi:Ca-activated chloride channel family protein